MTTEDRHFPFEQVGDEQLRQAVQILTTEHFALQSARGNVTAETNGRLAIYLGTLSSALIALAFVGQISQLGDAFHVFALSDKLWFHQATSYGYCHSLLRLKA